MGLRTTAVLAKIQGTVAQTGETVCSSLKNSMSAKIEYGVQVMMKAPIMTATITVDRFSAASRRRFFCMLVCSFTSRLLCSISLLTFRTTRKMLK